MIRKSNIADLRFHDLRQEHGSRLLGWGWSLLDVRDQIGHADVSTTNTYLNAAKQQSRDLMRRTDELRSRCTDVAREEQNGVVSPPAVDNEEPGKRLLHYDLYTTRACSSVG